MHPHSHFSRENSVGDYCKQIYAFETTATLKVIHEVKICVSENAIVISVLGYKF